MPLSPLIMAPIFKPKAWGGRRMADLLGKDLLPGQDIGESCYQLLQ